MGASGGRQRAAYPIVALAVLLVAGTLVRIVLVGAPGHSGDVFITSRWAVSLAQAGPWGFYGINRSVYPALLYVLWPIGLLFQGDALSTVVKGLSIPFDVGVGLLLFFGIRSIAGPWRAVAGAALYLFNPAVLIAGPMWGQLDAAGTLPFVAALLFLTRSRFGWAGAAAVVAMLVKPQFGLVAVPVLVLAVREGVTARDWRPLRRVALGGLVAYLALGIPLQLTPWLYADLVAGAATNQPDTSLYAPNPWGLLAGFDHPDGWLVYVGSALLLCGLVAAQLPLLRRRDALAVLAVGTDIVFAFYFLPTRVHERYLFPAMAAAAPLAVLGLPALAGYLLLSSAFALSLIQALLQITPWDVGEPLRSILVSPALTWGTGVALLAAAAALVAWGRPPLSRPFLKPDRAGFSDAPP
jgi:hypothetical protein